MDARSPLVDPKKAALLKGFIASKHAGSICVANYKGGVGKTTITCLLGYYLARRTKKKVLLFDIDPQCSLSLAFGFDPEEVNKTELTIYNLVKPSKWAKISKTNFLSYASGVKDSLAPKNLQLVKGSFAVEDLDVEIVKSLFDSSRRVDELFLYSKQMLNAFDDYEYILVDTPPNKMYLTQAMLRACSYFIPVTIPDEISIYGMPRLLQWVDQIPAGERPHLLGYVLNAVNRTGGGPKGKVNSQVTAESRLKTRILANLRPTEKGVLDPDPCLGAIPRLDAVARFLGERDAKFSRSALQMHTSSQPSVDECLNALVDKLIARMKGYNAKN
jgi:chromosome partitioning protein